jgi:hypothetical protein
MSGAFYGRNSWDQFEDLTNMAATDAGRHLWKRTDLKPTDVEVANIYDGFSILTLMRPSGYLGFINTPLSSIGIFGLQTTSQGFLSGSVK